MAAEPARKRARTKGSRAAAAAPAAAASAEGAQAAQVAGAPAGQEAGELTGGLADKIRARLQEAASAPTRRPAECAAPEVPAQAGASAAPAKAAAPLQGAIAERAAAAAAPLRGPATPATSAPPGASASSPSGSSGVAFLRLSAQCQPSVERQSQLVYLDRDEVSFGRMPTCNVVLDSTRAPAMISRTHGFVRRQATGGAGCPQKWVISNQSMNGILVNDEPVGEGGRELQPGDVVTFGRKMATPEFEFVFEAPEPAARQQAPPAAPLEELLGATEEIRKLKEQLAAEREQKEAEAQRRKQASETNLNITDELSCSVCQDYLVHASTVECSHTFCWSCINTWLCMKNFECPVCRESVRREPVRTRAVDTIVQKAVDRLPEEKKAEYAERVTAAETALKRATKLHQELEKSVTAALEQGKGFFKIDAHWSRKEKETFQRGVKDYSGDTRQTYCKLTGLTEQWVHSADDSKLNQALHNLGLASFVSNPEVQIRQRLLMFLRYG